MGKGQVEVFKGGDFESLIELISAMEFWEGSGPIGVELESGGIDFEGVVFSVLVEDEN